MRPNAGRANLYPAAVSEQAGESVDRAAATPAAPSDEQLVAQARGGRPAAFDLLIERYQKRAVSVAYRLVGNVHDALEVSQEAFIRAHRSLDGLEDAARFGPWLLRIVSNLSLNFRRDRAVGGRRVSLDDCVLDEGESAGQRLAAPAHSDENPGAALAGRELAEVVQRELAGLTEQQRMALVLFSVEQLPQKDVAEIMNVSVEAVKWHVFQARKALKERLADYL